MKTSKTTKGARDLLTSFEESGLPAGHLRAYRAGAGYGFRTAKRELIALIDLRLESEGFRVESATADNELVKLRHYVRNVLLWNGGDGGNE